MYLYQRICCVYVTVSNMTADQFGTITLKWDPKNLEIRTMSVEKTLEPLVLQVSVKLTPCLRNVTELCFSSLLYVER